MINTIIAAVVSAIVTACVTAAVTYLKTSKSEAGSIKEGVLSLLRLMIIQQHNKYMEQQYCSINEKGIIEKAYNAYHNLGGNGAITNYYNEIMNLPTGKE